MTTHDHPNGDRFHPPETFQSPDFGPEPAAGSAGSSAGNHPLSPVRPLRRHAPRPASAELLYTLFWLLCCSAFVVGLWHIGPQIAERYQFAMTRGKAMAEYSNAVNVLKDDPLATLSMASELIAQRIRPSVVSIECQKMTVSRRGSSGISEGQGSGVVIAADGLILTNAHVVADAQQIVVTLHDHRRLPAEKVGIDLANDLAVLRIPASGLVPAEWGDSENLKVGSMVWAIGSPYGLEQTVTSGIISGKNRYGQDPHSRQRQTQELIQTDAAVNKGNSGGPLVDSRGTVVGINTSIMGEQFQGISFAIPSSVARFISSQLVRSGNVDYGFLGIKPAGIDQVIAAQLGLPDLKGAFITEVTPGTPAGKAGLQPGDVIRSWNGIEIEDYMMVFRLVQTTLPGTMARMLVFRNGQQVELEIEITSRPPV